MAALGVAFAWRSRTTAGFHAVMNLLIMPMWLLSGAFFPAKSASPWLAAIMRIGGGPPWSLAASGAFAAVALAAAVLVVRR
jgi:ABC-2 type transport system permease protein